MKKRSAGFIIKKRILPILLFAFIAIQFVPKPERNSGNAEGPNYIGNKYPISTEVKQILTASCFNCHSNHTEYPWYTYIQPLSWWLEDHIKDGKKHLNFSEFTSYSLAKQYHKLEEIGGEVESGDMPLESYTFIHRDEKLDPGQKEKLIQWAESVKSTMKATYPTDSLLPPKRAAAPVTEKKK